MGAPLQMPAEMFTTTTVKRYAATVYTSGRPAAGAESTLTIRASVQPASPRELQKLPEGDRQKAAIVIFTPTLLRTTNEVAMTQPDRVLWESEWWLVQSVDDHLLGLGHYKAIATREEK